MLTKLYGLLSVINYKIIGVALLFVCWDIISGLTAAVVTHTFKSSLMREGGVHKLGTIMTLAFVVTLDIAQTICDIGINVPLTSMTCVFIIAMEIGSSWENIKKIWPDLARMKTVDTTVQDITNKDGLESSKQ